MNEQRIQVFRLALEGLIESLNAFVRLSRWPDGDAPPEPLRLAASKLVERLGSAERLAAGRFLGSPREVERVSVLCVAMRSLDAAYVKFRRRSEVVPERLAEASAVLEAEIGEASSLAGY